MNVEVRPIKTAAETALATNFAMNVRLDEERLRKVRRLREMATP